MPREKELFRDNLERLDKAFPNKEILDLAEVANYLGVCRRTLVKHLKIKKMRVKTMSKSSLASLLCDW